MYEKGETKKVFDFFTHAQTKVPFVSSSCKKSGKRHESYFSLCSVCEGFSGSLRKYNLKEISEINIDMSDSSTESRETNCSQGSCKEDKDTILERVRSLFGSEVSKLFEGE